MVWVLRWMVVGLLGFTVLNTLAQRPGSAPLLEPLRLSGIAGQIKLHNRFATRGEPAYPRFVEQGAPDQSGVTTPFRATVKVYSGEHRQAYQGFQQRFGWQVCSSLAACPVSYRASNHEGRPRCATWRNYSGRIQGGCAVCGAGVAEPAPAVDNYLRAANGFLSAQNSLKSC